MENIQVTVTTLDNKLHEFSGDSNTKVDDLRKWMIEKSGKKDTTCNLIFRGRLLKNGSSLADCGVGDKTFLRATFQTKYAPKPRPTAIQMTTQIQNLMVNFRACMHSMGSTGSSRLDTLFKALSETLREVSQDNKALANDRVAFLMAQDSKLHRTLLHKPQFITRALMQHPALLDALSMAVDRVSRSVSQSAAGQPSAEGNLPVHYGMDYLMIDDQGEEEGEGEEDEAAMEDQRARYPASSPLSSNQLSTAIASAVNQGARSGGAAQQGSRSTPGQARILASDLFAAVNMVGQTATGGAGASSHPTPLPGGGVRLEATSTSASGTSEDGMQEKLRSLAELGFTDEAAARRALEIANGNVEMAVDILLG